MTDVVIECPSETATNISCRDMPHITLPCRCSWTSIIICRLFTAAFDRLRRRGDHTSTWRDFGLAEFLRPVTAHRNLGELIVF